MAKRTVPNIGSIYRTQVDNAYGPDDTGPENTCSFTSLAIALLNVGLVGNGKGQFEDQISASYAALGLTRGSPEDMAYWVNKTYGKLGVRDAMTRTGSAADIRKAIDAGCVVVVHTDLTGSGHVIAIGGYDDAAYSGKGAWICLDPWGEWTSNGYHKSATAGNQIEYSYRLLADKAGPDGNYWIHVISRKA